MDSTLIAKIKTALVVGAIVCITVSVAALGVVRTRQAADAYGHLSTHELERQLASEHWRTEARVNWTRTAALLVMDDAERMDRLMQETNRTIGEIVELKARVRALVPEAKGRAILDRLDAAGQRYRALRDTLISAHRRGEDVQVRLQRELEPVAREYLARLEELNGYIGDELAARRAETVASARTVEWILMAGALAAIAMGLSWGIASLRADAEQRRSRQRQEHWIHHDALTGLPNRSLLDRCIQDAISERTGDAAGRVAVAVVGLAGVKDVHDHLGTCTGHEVLRTMGQRLCASVRGSDLVVKLDGDEFAVLFGEGFPPLSEACPSLQRILSRLGAPVEVEGTSVRVSCSIGVASWPHDAADADALIRNASAALREAQALGGDRFETYCRHMTADGAARYQIQAALADAIGRDELSLVYQPQVDLSTGRLFGVEALLRWKHPDMGHVSPGMFIPVAEQSNLIVEIGEWVLRTACTQSVIWRRAGLPPVVVAVNVSARQFRSTDFVGRVASILRETGARGSDIELELTESMLMNDVDAAVALMHGLRALGLQLAIDDFGTGYSSLAALQTFPLSRLKIDRAFIKCIEREDQDQPITSAIIDLGHRLDLRVLAEGIETAAQLSFLQRHRCDDMQGFLFSRPVPPQDIEAMLAGGVELDRDVGLAQGTDGRMSVGSLPAVMPIPA